MKSIILSLSLAALAVPCTPLWGQTNGISPTTPATPSPQTRVPFAEAVVETNLPDGIPSPGPWTVSLSDIRYPMNFTLDLTAQKRGSFYSKLWAHFSNDTQLMLKEQADQLHTPPAQVYHPGIELELLISNLNTIIGGESIYNKDDFNGIRLSGDTLRLLDENPSGTNLARLNRLLLEDALPLDLVPRPKIVRDPVTMDYAFVDIGNKSVTIFDKRGNRLSFSDLEKRIGNFPRRTAIETNPSIWDARFSSVFGTNLLLIRPLSRVWLGIDPATGQLHRMDR